MSNNNTQTPSESLAETIAQDLHSQGLITETLKDQLTEKLGSGRISPEEWKNFIRLSIPTTNEAIFQ
jgi:hypothetical protein